MKSRKSRDGQKAASPEDLVRALARDLKIPQARDLVSWSHVRRCHRCDGVCEQAGERVDRCPACGARFAPFFFSDLTPQILMEIGKGRFKLSESLISDRPSYRPLVGFSWWWSETSSPSGEKLMPRA